jgi:hypothetical protein
MALIPSMLSSAAGALEDTLRIYQILPEEAPNLHDGNLDDWRRLLPEPTFSHEDFYLVRNDPPPVAGGLGTIDLTFEIYLGWMAQPSRLYVGMQVWDDAPMLQSEGKFVFAGRDYFSVGIDPDEIPGLVNPSLSGDEPVECWDQVMERWYACEWDEPQQMWSLLPQAASEPILSHWLREWTQELPWSEVGGTRGIGGGSWVAEFWITPFDQCYYGSSQRSVTARLSAGKVVRYDLYIVDSEFPALPDSPDRTGPLYFVGSFNRIGGATNSQSWPTAVLMPARARPTAVQGESWGRVKQRTRSEP